MKTQVSYPVALALAGALLSSPSRGAPAVATAPLTVSVGLDRPLHPISPYIYGSNHEVHGYVFTDARRLGGNRLTPYNWEIDASNAGKDFRHQNDRWLATTDWWTATTPEQVEPEGTPGYSILRFHRESLARGAYSMVTVPIAGYVSGDADGPLDETDTAPSERWAAFDATSIEPTDPMADPAVRADQMVRFVVDAFGGAGDADGVRGYSLGNEPALWHKTHPRLHPEQATCEEVIEKSVATAQRIREADPDAEIYGPALWGITAFGDLSKAPDWKAFQKEGGYDWFVSGYLDQMKRASDQAGVRLLDAFDVHWYTEDPKERTWTGEEASWAARTLHDADYVEDTWVGKHFGRFLPLLPKIQASIAQWYPGTRIAVSEYDWPQTDTVHGGLNQVDALGAFGRHNVYFAAYHHRTWEKPDRYVGSAFSLLRNYDGAGGAFGDVALPVTLAGDHDVAVYAALDAENTRLHVVLANRSEHDVPAVFTLPRGTAVTAAEAWFFDGDNPAVRKGEAPRTAAGQIEAGLPALSATHLVLTLDAD